MKNSTNARTEAARANGRLSKGPKTAEGKARSARNSVQHRLYSTIVVLNNEDQSQFDSLLASYLDHFQPANQVESDLVSDIVCARWRLIRVLALETTAMDYETDRLRPRALSDHKRIDEATITHLATRHLNR